MKTTTTPLLPGQVLGFPRYAEVMGEGYATLFRKE
jgi:hypothetical protein